MMRRLLMLILLLALAAPLAAAETARAWLDRDTVQMGDTLTLNVETTESTSEPDFSALQADFELLNRSSSTSVSIVNGSTASTQLWAVGLRPRREGKLTIPPIVVGSSKTQPVSLTVGAAPAVATSQAGDDFFIEVSADPLAVYVQQQVRVTVKFFYAINLTDGGVEELSAADAVVQKLGQDRGYDTERAGRRYRVLERRYAVSAEKSGTLQLPALTFRGRALAGNDPNALFFGRGRAVTTRSDALSIAVQPRPAAAGQGPWLPAQSLELRSEGLDAATRGKVGEPLTLTLTTVAQGLGFEQLPELNLPEIEGAEVYPDKSVTRSRESGGWIIGERSRKFAIVPKRPGTLHIPAVALDWWDAGKNQSAQAQTSGIDIEVDPAAAGAAATPAAASGAAVPATAAVADPAAETTLAFWRIVALCLLLLWLLTVAVGLLLWRRRGSPGATSAARVAPDPAGRRGFDRAVAAGDPAAAARQLLAWARKEGFAAGHLGQLAAQLQSPAQREAIARLQAALYAAGGASGLPPGLAAAFASGLQRLPPVAANEDAVLPPLWSSKR
jgi:BatD DUF11 like domain